MAQQEPARGERTAGSPPSCRSRAPSGAPSRSPLACAAREAPSTRTAARAARGRRLRLERRGARVDESDVPGSALACLESNEIAATREGEADNELVLEAGPRIRFYLTADEAEAAQFQGRGEGAEQIGSALLFVDPEVDPETEDILDDVEGCLADL